MKIHNYIKVLIVFFLCIPCGYCALPMSKENIADLPYKWIEQDKMRAGYLYYYSPVSKIDLVRELGLNTVIVKCWKFGTTKDRMNTVKSIKNWAKTAKDNNIHLFVAVNWQPYPYMKVLDYKKIIYDDGTKGVAVDPFDRRFWENQIQDIFSLIANLSIQQDLQIDGIFLDMEIYGSEKEPAVKKNYYECKCGFGDRSFSQYLTYKGYEPSQFPLVEERKRKDWLEGESLLDDYFVFLRSQIQTKARDLEIVVHNINPDLLLGMYPHPSKNNWVQYSLAKGFSSKKLPLIVFGTHSYGYYKDKNGDGYTFIPIDIKSKYLQDDINSLYCAGYLLRKYNGQRLEKNLFQSISNWDGYWLYKLPQLWEENPASDKLKDTVSILKQSLITVNIKKK